MRKFLGCLVLLMIVAPAVLAADWPQFLGPDRDNSSDAKLAAWTGELKPAWSVAIGDAHSSPVVVGDMVYAFYQPKKVDADALAAYDAKTGELRWEKSYPRAAFSPPFGKGPRSTPVVSNGRVFTLGSTGVLAAWDAKTGEVMWQVDTLKEFSAKNLYFGISMSPIVEGNTVIIMVGGKGHGLVGFDTMTGKVQWQMSDDPASYSSPVAFGKGDDRQVAFLTGSNLRAVSPSGKPLWAVPFKDLLNESSTSPVKVGDLVIGSSVTAGSIGLKLGGEKPEKIWSAPKLTCYFSTPVAVGETLYMINGAATLSNPSVTLRCVEAKTGKVLWEKPKVGRYHAALVKLANDKLLMLDDNGNLKLLAVNPKEYQEVATAKVCGVTWAHPAIVGTRVYLRDERKLYAFELMGE